MSRWHFLTPRQDGSILRKSVKKRHLSTLARTACQIVRVLLTFSPLCDQVGEPNKWLYSEPWNTINRMAASGDVADKLLTWYQKN